MAKRCLAFKYSGVTMARNHSNEGDHGNQGSLGIAAQSCKVPVILVRF
jgi:hypothetical protein